MNPKTVKDSDSLATSNPFEEFNNNLVKGKPAVKQKDSDTIPKPVPAKNAFEQFNNDLKKKDFGGGLELPPNESPEASIYSSNGGKEAVQKIIDDAKQAIKDDVAISAPAAPFSPFQANQQPEVSKIPLDTKVLTFPKELSAYVDKRSDEINNRIKELTAKKESLQRSRSVTDESIEQPKEGEQVSDEYAMTIVTNPQEWNKVRGEIKTLNDRLNKLKKSAVEVNSYNLARDFYNKNKGGASIGIPRDLGRDIVRFSDKLTNDQYTSLENKNTPLGPVPNAQMEQLGIDAWKKFILTTPEIENRDQLIKDVQHWESDFDNNNPDITAARVRHKLGATLYKDAGFGSSIFRRKPSIQQIEEAAKKSDLTPSEMENFKTYVLPVEKRIIGTEIPMSGFINKFGEAVQGSVLNLGNVFRGDSDRLKDALNESVDTRLQEVGESTDLGELEQLKKKQKTKEGVNESEKKRINQLEKYNDVRTWYDKFWDGSGDLTGQVAYQAGIARLFGGIGQLATKAPVVGGLISKGTSIAGGKDAINLMVTSFLTSYDNHAKEAALLMPRDDQALERRLYSWTMSGVEGLSERIFPDTKVLDAFKKSISPDVVKLSSRLANKEISEVAARTRLQEIIADKLKPFAKEFTKSEVQESSEEAIVDLAQGISETVFAGKDFDTEKTFGNAANTFLTTMAYSPFVSGLAASKDVRSSAMGKSGIFKMAQDPETYRQEIYRQQQEGMPQAEADKKLQIINTAAEIAKQLPVKKNLNPKKNADVKALNDEYKDNIREIGERTDVDDKQKEKLKQIEDKRHAKEVADYIKKQGQANKTAMDYPESVNYLTHRLNEAILEKEIAGTKDEIVKKDLQKQLDRSKKIREGIYNGQIIVGNNLEEITEDEKLAEELDITPVDQADKDSLPFDIVKPKIEEDGNKQTSQQDQADAGSGEETGSQQQPSQESDAKGINKEGQVNVPVEEGSETTALPPGMSQEQFNKLPEKIKEKLLKQANEPKEKSITFKNQQGKELTGKKIEIPGYEDIDLIMVENGFEKDIYELASGMKVADTAGAFSQEDAIDTIRDTMLESKVTSSKIFKKLKDSSDSTLPIKNPVKAINESPAYKSYLEQQTEAYKKLPDVHDDAAKEIFRELKKEADEKGLTRISEMIDRELGKKQQKFTISITPDKIENMMSLEEKDKKTRETKAKNIPLPEDEIKKRTATMDDLRKNVNDVYRTDQFDKIEDDVKEKALEAFQKEIDIFNKFGYWPKEMSKIDLGIVIALNRYLAAKNSKKNYSEQRIKDSLNDIQTAIEQTEKIHGELIGETKKEEPAKEVKLKKKPETFEAIHYTEFDKFDNDPMRHYIGWEGAFKGINVSAGLIEGENKPGSIVRIKSLKGKKPLSKQEYVVYSVDEVKKGVTQLYQLDENRNFARASKAEADDKDVELTEEENTAIAAIRKKDLTGTSLEKYANVINDEDSTNGQLKDALKGISDQLTDVDTAQTTDEQLGASLSENIYDLGYEEIGNRNTDQRAAATPTTQEFEEVGGKVVPKKKVQQPSTEAVPADVSFQPLENINTDTKRFQPRAAEFSKESVNKIVNDYDENKLDPVVLYRDKNGKDYVLAGHSRLEAHEKLSELPDTDPRKQKAIEKGFRPGQIKARYFTGTEQEAKEFADRSNDLGTKNKDYESANSLRKSREAGTTKKSIQDRAKTDFGKNWRYIYNLSYLNPNGKTLQTLKQFEENPDKEAQNKIEKNAQWIGAVRERLGDMVTDQHENEMFDYLMDKSRSTKLERENDFISLIQNITGRFDYNPNEPLNLNRVKNKSVGEVNHDIEEKEIKEAIKERQSDLDNLNDRLNNPQNPAYVNPNASDYKAVLANAEKKKTQYNAELTALRKELLEHQQAKGKTISEGINQMGLFDMNNLTSAEQEQTNNELQSDGINLNNIQDYESLSNPEELQQENINNASETAPVSQNIQPTENEQGGSTQQDQGSTELYGQERTGEAIDPIEQQKREKLTQAKKAFSDSLRKARGQANVTLLPIDPEVIANGVKLMAAYADLGLYKFKQIIEDIAETLGTEFLDKPNIDALKGVYSYYRSNLPKEERAEFDNEESLDDFIENDLQFYTSPDGISEEEGLNRAIREYEKDGDAETVEYYREELELLKENPFVYWSNLYNAYSPQEPVTDERQIEAYENIIKIAQPGTYWASRQPDPRQQFHRVFKLKEFIPNRLAIMEMSDGTEYNITDNAFVSFYQQIFDDKAIADYERNANQPLSLQDISHRHPWLRDFLQGYYNTPLDEREEYTNDKVNSLAGDDNRMSRREILSAITGNFENIDESSVDRILTEINKKLDNGTGTTSNLEPDRPRRTTGDTVGQGLLFNSGESDRIEAEENNDTVISQPQPISSPGLLPFDAITVGESGDSALPIEEQLNGLETSPSESGISGGSIGLDDTGISPDTSADESIEAITDSLSGLTIAEKIEQQKAAEPIPVKLMDIDNIRATLPFLMPAQQEDVYKAEVRFHGPDSNNPEELYGKGMMFTNGTGTGKTLTGLGIAKRMQKMGKANGLIIVPSDVKAKDWMAEASDYMQMNVHQLEGVQDRGKQNQANITTYANFRENPFIRGREWDYVIYDESHKINSNGAGTLTSGEIAHNEATLSPRQAKAKAKIAIRYDQRSSEINERNSKAFDRGEARDYEAQKLLEEELKNQTIREFKKTKVVFLSATPFAYHPNLSYADGYLFKINESFDDQYGTNSYNNFYISNFGYRIRYNKLTKPESGVDVDLLERQFTEGLKNKGVIVSRKLEVEQDYSRQFIVADDEIGKKIDEGMSILSDHDKFNHIHRYIHRHFSFLYKNQLMEGIKAKWAVNRIKQHLALGRKVVVSHTYIENEPKHPFDFDASDLLSPDHEDYRRLQDEIDAFKQEYPEYRALDLRGLQSPIQTIKAAFGKKAVFFNGQEKKADRSAAKKAFNDDNSGVDIFVVQMDAGKEGISLHDRTGKHPRALINLGLPYKPTDAIQIEGRIYRTGQKSDAIIEYPILNLNFEKFAYADKINQRVRTAENLALGEEARNMETAFKEGYINGTDEEPGDYQGKGGKKEDSRMDKTTEFQKALTYYYKRGKRTTAQKRQVSGDYYATPEPLGYKMVEWSDVVPNEKMAEPSAGHGAIARFFPRTTMNTFIEPNDGLRSEVALNAFGTTHAGNFEDLHIVNKYDAIVMNPPFGKGGKLAMEHLKKATEHLNDGGRVVALVPTGQMNDRITNWQDSKDSEGYYITARINLPSVVFERAGTQVSTQILVIDKAENEKDAQKLPLQRNIDLSSYDTIKDFFDAIEDLQLSKRVSPGQYAVEKVSESSPSTANENTPSPGPEQIAQVVKTFHAKNQHDVYVVKMNKQVDYNEFLAIKQEAQNLGGYYSNFKGNGAVPGFQFKDEATAKKLLSQITGENVPEAEKMSIADRIRTWKISNEGKQLYSTIIPGGPHIWNAAVEIVAKAVEAGEALVDALRTGRLYIEKSWPTAWQRTKYNQEMMMELKGRGVLKYNLSPTQIAEADAAISRISKSGKLIKEINALREAFDAARALLTDPADIKDLEDSYNEFERYIFDKLSAQEIDKIENFSLGLDDQTWWQKQKENWQNRYQRLEQVQKEIEKAGITIDEKNDMVNRADRWKSIAAAKIDNALKEVGLSDTDIFIWKGRQKVENSLFDQMAKDGVDYRKFNLFMYAKHAPERNAHNAKLRRENFAKKMAQMDIDLQKLNDDYLLHPTSILKGLITKKTNEIEAYEEYESAYNDPAANKNYVKLLEKKIDRKYILMDDGGSGMTNAQAKDILQEVEDEGNTVLFETYEEAIREKVIQKSLDLQKEYGLLDDENYEYLKNYYTNYVPLKVDDAFFEKGQTFTDSGIPGAKIYKSKGANYYTFENRINPVTQSVIDLQATIYEGEQNEYKKTVAETIRSAPDKDIWELQTALYAPVKDKAGKITGLNEINVPDNGIPFMENGQKKYLVINDEALYKAMTNMNVKQAIPILSKINGLFRSLYTIYNPAFTVSNLFRDVQTAGLVLSATQKGDVATNYRNNLKRIFSIIKGSFQQQGGADSTYWQQKSKEYKDAGGNMTWFQQDTTQDMVEDIEDAYKKYEKSGALEAGKNLGVKLADFVMRANAAVENSTRLAIYDALLKSGTPQYKAVEVARNATINFQKKGNFGPMADSLFLFFNASVQGTTNVLKTLLTTKAGLKMAGGIVMAGMLTTLYNNMMDDCGPDADPANCYKNIPDYEKERNIIIKIPGGRGFLKIPLAWGFNVFFNAGEQIAQGMNGNTTLGKAASFLFKSAANSFNPTGSVDQPLLQHISPTATDPIVQYYTNKDGFGRPIYNDNEYDRRPDSQKQYPSDSRNAKNLSEWLNKTTGGNEKVKGKVNVTPGTLDWLWETFTGGMGQFAAQSVSSARDAFDPKADVNVREVPIVNRFYTAPRERSDRQFIYNKLDDSYNTIMTPEEVKKFNDELSKAVTLSEIAKDKADKYRRTVQKNQYELNNQELFSTIDQSKERKLEKSEIENFVEQLEQRATSGEFPKDWIRTYKAEITKNQKKFKE